MSNEQILRNFQIDGMQELLQYLGDLGDKAPRQSLSKGVRKGANRILSDARVYAPSKTGLLKSNLYLKTEKGNTKKLKVFIDVMWRPNVAEFVKPWKHIRSYGGLPNESGNYYYPGSQEYGFKTADGSVEGKYFLKNARDTNDGPFMDIIEQTLQSEIDRLG